MARSFKRIRAVQIAVAVGLVIMQQVAFGCGLNWNEPQSHFKGVSFQGYVFHVENLGKIDFGKGLQLPLRAIFRSESNASSPYVGQGWDIPLLESHIVQINDCEFRMVEPTGWFRFFWRDGKDPSLLHGQNGWKAEIKGNTITAWADCGSKLVFNAGKITQLQLKDRTFEYVYSCNKVSEIREGGRTQLAVKSDQSTGVVTGLSYGGQQIGFELGDKPQVQVINGQNFVASVEKSLGKLTLPDATTKEYEHAVNEKLQPTLSIFGPQKRVIAWNPSSKIIVSDGVWTYDVTPSQIPGSNAAIDRSNSSQEKEFWHYDGVKGQEVVQDIAGVRTVTTWFTSGKLAGKLRKVVEITNGSSNIISNYKYDSNGMVIEEMLSGWNKRLLSSQQNALEKTKFQFTKHDDEHFVTITVEPNKSEYKDSHLTTIAIEHRAKDNTTQSAFEYHKDGTLSPR